MKTKFKDILLYSFAAIGVCALFIATTNVQPTTPKYEVVAAGANGSAYLYNKETGEVWGMRRQELGSGWAKVEKIK